MRINKYLAVLLGLALLVSPSLVYSQAKVGTTGMNFLELGVSARAMGMAEAYSSAVSDASAVYYNPAGLTYVYGREVMFTHIDMPAGVNYEFFGLAYPVSALSGVVGVGIYALTTGDILRTDYNYPFGVDAAGNAQYFDAGDLAISLSYSRFLTDKFSFGITMKFVQENLELYQAKGLAADVGTCYNSGFRNFKIGMVITNFGPDMKFIEKDFPLPINFKFGASIDVIDSEDHLMTFAMEGSHPSDNLEKYNMGLEYTIFDKFSLRAGQRFNYDSDGLTLGGGLLLPIGDNFDLSVDYAYQDFGFLTEVHRFSLGMVF
jgi:long-subunit fatty acid transport protein